MCLMLWRKFFLCPGGCDPDLSGIWPWRWGTRSCLLVSVVCQAWIWWFIYSWTHVSCLDFPLIIGRNNPPKHFLASRLLLFGQFLKLWNRPIWNLGSLVHPHHSSGVMVWHVSFMIDSSSTLKWIVAAINGSSPLFFSPMGFMGTICPPELVPEL